MYKIDFNNPIHIHFIGIGGISMSGLAKILLSKGFTVSGSDAHSSALTDELIGDGCIVSVPQSAGNITNDIEIKNNIDGNNGTSYVQVYAYGLK